MRGFEIIFSVISKVVSAKRGLEEEAKEAKTKDEGEKSNFLFQMYELVEPDEQQEAEAKKPKVQEVIAAAFHVSVRASS